MKTEQRLDENGKPRYTTDIRTNKNFISLMFRDQRGNKNDSHNSDRKLMNITVTGKRQRQTALSRRWFDVALT